MTRYMKTQLSCHVFIIEIDPEAFHSAIQYAEDGFCGDAEQLKWMDQFRNIRFDAILFADVLEHLRQPETILKSAGQLLRDDGKVLISIPNIAHADILCNLYQNRFSYTKLGLLDDTHVHFWGEKDLDGFAESSGFQIVEKDASYADMFTTEQNPDTNGLPMDLAKLLEKKPFANVYEFVLVLQKIQWANEHGISCISNIDPQGQRVPSIIYFDTGKGYSLLEMAYVQPDSSDDAANNCVFSIDSLPPSCRAIRFDPVEGVAVLLQRLNIESNKGPLLGVPLNGFSFEEDLLFLNTDPQIEILIPSGCSQIKIEASIYPLSDKLELHLLKESQRELLTTKVTLQEQVRQAEKTENSLNSRIINIQSRLTETQNEKASLNDQLAEAQSEKANLNSQLVVQLEECQVREKMILKLSEKNSLLKAQKMQMSSQLASFQASYESVVNSQCWRMTAPLRSLLDRLKTIYLIRQIHKGLRIWRAAGFRTAWFKAREYLAAGGKLTAAGAVPKDPELVGLAGLMLEASQPGGMTFMREKLEEFRNPSGKGRRILLISHELTLTGAPMALYYYAKSVKKNGDRPAIVSPRDGRLRQTLCEDGIPVVIAPFLYQHNIKNWVLPLFDFVVVNTIAGHPVISMLAEASVPVLWWIHEANASYPPAIQAALPKKLPGNVRVYCGGAYAASVLHQYRPAYQTEILLYNVPEVSVSKATPPILTSKETTGRTVFAMVGMQEERKGQDILADAILKMPPDHVAECLFVFVGKRYFFPIAEQIRKLCKQYPKSTKYIEELDRDNLQQLYQQMDCLICASRDDPMPVVVTDALMLSKIVICSENTGSASLIGQTGGGLIYRNNDPAELASCIESVRVDGRHMDSMRQKARETYECFFSESVFETNVRKAMDQVSANVLKNRAKGFVSVVIPTYNAGEDLLPLITALRAQTGIDGLEILLVDSGSRDGTPELAERLGAKVIRIPHAEFSHSHARNLGAERAKGEYLLFMTQDAAPGGPDWVYDMLRPILRENVTAVSCRELPRPNCDLLGRITGWLHAQFMGILNGDRILSLPEQQNFDSLRKNGQLDDVACLIRRSVFLQFSYRGDYAEDLDLGIRLIRAGYRLALLSSTHVVHSHTRPAIYHLKRAVVDILSLKRILPDYPITRVTEAQARNRILTAYCMTVQYVKYFLSTCEEQETLTEFCKRADGKCPEILNCTQNMTLQEIQALVEEKIPYVDDDLRTFLRKLMSIGSDVAFDPTAFTEAIYFITHSIADYLKMTGKPFTPGTKKEICDAMVKRYGQIAGNVLADYSFWNSKENSKLGALIKEYSCGI
ncbi:glycosyltransferase [Caproicibacter fermentans]|nr:glycosyltransferase [Caproicibacter fermentans]